MVEGAGECESPGTVTFESGWHVLDDDLMPAHDIMQLRYWSKLDSPARILWDIAEKSKVRTYSSGEVCALITINFRISVDVYHDACQH